MNTNRRQGFPFHLTLARGIVVDFQDFGPTLNNRKQLSFPMVFWEYIKEKKKKEQAEELSKALEKLTVGKW